MKQDKSPFRYTPWLARDVAATAGVLFLVVIVVVCVILWRLSRVAQDGMVPAIDTVQKSTFDNVLTVAVLIAVGGMVSTDLQGGFYRAYFSKPMPTWWYYLQRWVIGGIAVLLLPFVFGAGLEIVLGQGFGITTDLMATIALGFLLIGGSVFLLSIFTRRDWLLVFIIATAQRALGSFIEAGMPISTTVKRIWQLLPPYHLIQPDKPVLEGSQLMHVVTYGFVMVVMALVLLRTRPLGSGGRA